MKRNAGIVLAVALLTMAAACHKDNREAQLKALDEAYQSGVFTKEEYDAKKQALVGLPPAAPATPAVPAAAAPVATAPAIPDDPPPPPPPPDTPGAAPRPTTPAAAPPVAAVPRTVPAPAPAAPAVPPASPAAPPASAGEPAPLAGCQDAESRSGGPKGVQERFFPASVDVVRQAALRAFTNLDFAVQTSSASEIEASKRKHLSAVVGAGGERVILHFSGAHQGGQAGTKVTGETKKSIVGHVSQKTWTSAVLAQIACNLRGGR
jgi:hypothetical protein